MGSIATGVETLRKAEKFSPDSKFIELVEYNPKEKTMDITFRSGTRVRYLSVNLNTYLSFKTSPTIDSFYARAIKGNIQSVKLVDQGIGRQKSEPLKKVHDRRTLDAGLAKQQTREQRTHGTVARAFAAA